MGKVIIIPEPHISSTNIEGRADYIVEIKDYLAEIMEIIKDDQEICWVSFVGDIFNRGLCLPSDNKMTAWEQDRVIEIVKSCFE